MPSRGECFIIAPIGDAESDTRKRTELLFKFVIRPALRGQYETGLPHQIAQTGKITMNVIEKIVTVPLLIADLTDSNANVFYELSLRHALNQPAILLIKAQQLNDIPFDVQGLHIISYDLTDPSRIETTVKLLRDLVISTVNNPTQNTNVISENLTLVSEPAGPDDNKVFLGTLLIANRFRFELIEPYFENLESLELRNNRLQNAFQSIMWESAQKTWVRRMTVLSVFHNDKLKNQVSKLFDEVEIIIPMLVAAMDKSDEEEIKEQLTRWRVNNSTFLKIWAQQYGEWIMNLNP